MTATNLSAYYPALLETLLSGRAICGHSHPTLHRLLSQGHVADRVDNQDADDGAAADYGRSPDRIQAESVLESLGRRLACSDDVFYAVYSRVDEHATQAIKERFERYTTQAPFLAEFFDILRESRPGHESFAPGDRFDFSEVNHAIMSAPSLNERIVTVLGHISQSRNPTPESALRRAVDGLVSDGYLVPVAGSTQSYVVGGELALFDAYRDFVTGVLGVSLDESDEDEPEATHQAELLQ
jgi:hypothetical protein